MASDPPGSPTCAEAIRDRPGTPKNPWDQFPVASAGDLNCNVTFAAVGRALSNWNEYEHSLAYLFSSFIALNRQSLAAIRALGAIHSFEGRLEMVREAGKTYFSHRPHAKMQEKFTLILSHGKKFVARRNEIAHGLVRPYPVQPEGSPQQFCLVPSWFDPKKTTIEGGALIAYSSRELLFYSNEFSKLPLPVYELNHHIVVSGAFW